VCQNDNNNPKKKLKKNILNNQKIIDGLDNPLSDIQNLFDSRCYYQNGIRISREE
ncbi:1381_t:CDS:1, partial [Gigaspora margarita]